MRQDVRDAVLRAINRQVGDDTRIEVDPVTHDAVLIREPKPIVPFYGRNSGDQQ